MDAAEALNKIFWKLVLTSGGGFLTVVGLISLLVWRKRIVALFTGADAGEGQENPGRRRDDALLNKFMDAYERNTEAFVETAKAQARIVDILHDFKEEFRAMAARMDRLADKA